MNTIREKIVKYYRTADCDRYGQLKTIAVGNVIDYRNEEEVEYLSSVINVSTYGYQYGTYKGFSPFGAFKCAELEKECTAAFKENRNRTSNLNSW
jgi:hypothetical protein